MGYGCGSNMTWFCLICASEGAPGPIGWKGFNGLGELFSGIHKWFCGAVKQSILTRPALSPRKDSAHAFCLLVLGEVSFDLAGCRDGSVDPSEDMLKDTVAALGPGTLELNAHGSDDAGTVDTKWSTVWKGLARKYE